MENTGSTPMTFVTSPPYLHHHLHFDRYNTNTKSIPSYSFSCNRARVAAFTGGDIGAFHSGQTFQFQRDKSQQDPNIPEYHPSSTIAPVSHVGQHAVHNTQQQAKGTLGYGHKKGDRVNNTQTNPPRLRDPHEIQQRAPKTPPTTTAPSFLRASQRNTTKQ